MEVIMGHQPQRRRRMKWRQRRKWLWNTSHRRRPEEHNDNVQSLHIVSMEHQPPEEEKDARKFREVDLWKTTTGGGWRCARVYKSGDRPSRIWLLIPCPFAFCSTRFLVLSLPHAVGHTSLGLINNFSNTERQNTCCAIDTLKKEKGASLPEDKQKRDNKRRTGWRTALNVFVRHSPAEPWEDR